MSNIVQFTPRRSDRVDRVIINGSFVSETIVHSERGTERIVHQPAGYRYFVNLIEVGPDGGEMGLWDGKTHAEAMAVARQISRDWGNLPIIDHVREAPV
jgi:hypothetical protein